MLLHLLFDALETTCLILERGLRGTTFWREGWVGRHNNGHDACRGVGTLRAAAAL